jgi:hypothetical protein
MILIIFQSFMEIITLRAQEAEKCNYIFIDNGSTGQVDLIVVRYSASDNCLSFNNRLHFPNYTVKVNSK